MNIIIGEKAGFCAGITNAVNKAKEFIRKRENQITYCLGDLLHNPVVMESLYQKGLKVINNLSEIDNPKGKSVIIRAHGVTKKIYDQAEQLGIELYDLTCPKVLGIHILADKYTKEGYYILLIGERNHAEVIGTASFCGEQHKIIENEEQLQDAINYIKHKKIQKISIIAQTTFNLEKFNKFVNKIQNEVNAEIIVKNTICDATRIRQQETAELSKKVDYMIVIGGRKSSNTNKLYNISCENCKNVIMIEKAEEITNEQVKEISNHETIGIMAGASTPQESIEEVKNKIQNLVVNIS